jgi:hypothetical protein
MGRQDKECRVPFESEEWRAVVFAGCGSGAADGGLLLGECSASGSKWVLIITGEGSPSELPVV